MICERLLKNFKTEIDSFDGEPTDQTFFETDQDIDSYGSLGQKKMKNCEK